MFKQKRASELCTRGHYTNAHFLQKHLSKYLTFYYFILINNFIIQHFINLALSYVNYTNPGNGQKTQESIFDRFYF